MRTKVSKAMDNGFALLVNDEIDLPAAAITGLIIHFGSAASAGWQVTDDILQMFQSIFTKGMCCHKS